VSRRCRFVQGGFAHRRGDPEVKKNANLRVRINGEWIEAPVDPAGRSSILFGRT
jgi:hypothetical protein